MNLFASSSYSQCGILGLLYLIQTDWASTQNRVSHDDRRVSQIRFKLLFFRSNSTQLSHRAHVKLSSPYIFIFLSPIWGGAKGQAHRQACRIIIAVGARGKLIRKVRVCWRVVASWEYRSSSLDRRRNALVVVVVAVAITVSVERVWSMVALVVGSERGEHPMRATDNFK